MGDKIYLVTSGSYSDYGVTAAFTDRELAAAAIERHKEGDRYESFDIEEFPLNPDVLSNGRLGWCVEMQYDSGDHAKVRQLDLGEVIKMTAEGKDGEVFDRYSRPPCKIFWCECYADDETHAIKIANERRAMFKAKGENDGRDV